MSTLGVGTLLGAALCFSAAWASAGCGTKIRFLLLLVGSTGATSLTADILGLGLFVLSQALVRDRRNLVRSLDNDVYF